MISQLILICVGASLGALSRWQLGEWFNAANFALGTWLANVLGCLMMGLALTWHGYDASKLLLITGFLGSFTTLSALSAEVVGHLLQGDYVRALGLLLLHIVLGVLMTVVGVLMGQWWLNR